MPNTTTSLGILIPGVARTGQTVAVTGGLWRGSTGGSKLSPIPLGSAASGLLVPEVGGGISINQFGLDVAERIWTCATDQAARLKPDIDDPDPYVGGLTCVASRTEDGEGLRSTVRATYKGVINGKLRPPRRKMSMDIEMQEVNPDLGSTAIGGGSTGSGDIQVVVGNNKILHLQIPVPTPVYTVRGATNKEPDSTNVGKFGTPPSVPKVQQKFVFPYKIYPSGIGSTPTVVNILFVAHPSGWLLERMDWDPAGAYFETTESYRLTFLAAGLTTDTGT